MKINVQTPIKTNQKLADVFSLFNEEMFNYLTQNAPVHSIRYDGDEIGSEIHLNMILPWKDKWISVITDRSMSDDVCYFVDEGKQLPFNIIEWRHTHIVRQVDGQIIIEDDIYFKSSNLIFDLLWWLCFVPQFLIRKPQYRSYLKKKLSL